LVGPAIFYLPINLATFRGIGYGAKLAWAAIEFHAGANGWSIPRVETLAFEIGISVRQVQYDLRELELAGLLRMKRRKGRTSTRSFELLWRSAIFHDWRMDTEEGRSFWPPAEGEPFTPFKKFHCICVPCWLARHPDRSPGAKILWGWLDRQRHLEVGSLNSGKIPEAIGSCTRQVRNYLRELEGAGLLELTQRPGHTPTFDLRVPAIFVGTQSTPPRQDFAPLAPQTPELSCTPCATDPGRILHPTPAECCTPPRQDFAPDPGRNLHQDVKQTLNQKRNTESETVDSSSSTPPPRQEPTVEPAPPQVESQNLPEKENQNQPAAAGDDETGAVLVAEALKPLWIATPTPKAELIQIYRTMASQFTPESILLFLPLIPALLKAAMPPSGRPVVTARYFLTAIPNRIKQGIFRRDVEIELMLREPSASVKTSDLSSDVIEAINELADRKPIAKENSTVASEVCPECNGETWVMGKNGGAERCKCFRKRAVASQ
jgi:hypothetical protein